MIVTCRKALSAGAGTALKKAIGYVLREGAGRGGADAILFGPDEDQVDPKQFLAHCREDPAHYGLIVSPGENCPLDDLRDYCRRLMQNVGRDRGAELDWVATEHHDTGRPHLHILLRDRTLEGRRLNLRWSYLGADIRGSAQDLATDILGPFLERTSTAKIQGRWFTALDHVIVETSKDGLLVDSDIAEPYRQDVLRRLRRLETSGWVRTHAPGRWEVPSDLQQRLSVASREHRRETAALRVLSLGAWRQERARLEAFVLEPGDQILGALVGYGRCGPGANGPQTVVIDSTDGRLGHLTVRNLVSVMCLDQAPAGAVIAVSAAPRQSRSGDEAIASVAAARGGVWSKADHRIERPGDWPKFVGFLQTRLEGLAVDGACTSLDADRFAIPEDFRARALSRDVQVWGKAELTFRVLDDRTIEQQITSPGLTWLDRMLGPSGRPALSGPFGEAVKNALVARAAALRRTGLFSGDPLVLTERDLQQLLEFECRRVLEPLQEDGRALFLLREGERECGLYVRRVHIAGEPYAVLKGGSATFVAPWKPGMESCRNRVLEATVQGGEVSFRSLNGAERRLALGDAPGLGF